MPAYFFRELTHYDCISLADQQATTMINPWNVGQLKDGVRPGNLAIAVEAEGELLGGAIFSKVLDEAELQIISITGYAQGHGLGYALLCYGLGELTDYRVRRCYLEVMDINEPAIALYEKVGFKRDGVRRDYYHTPYGPRNAILMSIDLPLAAAAKR